MSDPTTPVVRVAMEMGHGHDEDLGVAIPRDHAIRKSTEATSSEVRAEQLAAFGEGPNPTEDGGDLIAEVGAQAGPLLLIIGDRLAELTPGDPEEAGLQGRSNSPRTSSASTASMSPAS